MITAIHRYPGEGKLNRDRGPAGDALGDQLARRIRTMRERANLSTRELAQRLKPSVSASSVSYWECNGAYPGNDRIIQLAKIFNCSPEYLMFGSQADTIDPETFAIAFRAVVEAFGDRCLDPIAAGGYKQVSQLISLAYRYCHHAEHKLDTGEIDRYVGELVRLAQARPS